LCCGGQPGVKLLDVRLQLRALLRAEVLHQLRQLRHLGAHLGLLALQLGRLAQQGLLAGQR
jgi:hypothetical protein